MMEHNHVTKKVEEIEAAIKRGETVRIQAQTRLDTLKEQRKDNTDEMKALGINPDKSAEELEKLSNEISAEIEALENIIPYDVIQSYQR